ncbi:cation-dependent mannose-6-phosphate receptor isoform 1-T3 [Polymixia lowei]
MKVSNGPKAVPVLVWTVAVQLVLCGSWVYASDNTTSGSTDSCKLVSDSVSERKVLSRLESLTKESFTMDTTGGDETYTYVFRICGDAGGVQGAGLIQRSKKDIKKKPTIIGMYNSTQVIGGSDWVILIYRNGDRYIKHCSNEMRRAIVMISCNRKVDMGVLEVVLEDRDRGQDCFYLFELEASALCPAPILEQPHLSTGSVILIIGLCLLAVYLIGGFLYQRLVVGAKGMEQFPNHAFWVEVGNLTADGCDFVCRSRNREEPPTYRGVTSDPLEEGPEERDDHLLPM